MADAQSAAQAAAHPAFEVATLKPSADPRIMCIVPERNGDRFTCHGAPLILLIAYAYNIPTSRIEGQLHGGYSVDAKIDPSATDEQARLMLQSLLEERLKLVVHRETREVQGYTLVIAKNGPKLKDANPSADLPPMPNYMAVPVTEGQGQTIRVNADGRGVSAIVGRGGPISQLADQLSNVLKTPVVDRTGLTGKYYFELKFQNPAYQISTTTEDYTPAADLSSALPDQLGLKLEKAKVAAEYLVVDHAEKPAAE
ncbi:MAG TPA: TIGR03435 family protein [Acidobacteriaceae bacterium]